MDISCELDRQILSPQGGNVVLWVQCTHGGPASRSPDLSVAAVIDRSTSMRGEKLEGAKNAARALIDQLTGRDRLVLVAFDRGAEVLAAGSVVNRHVFRQAIDELEVKNGTNLGLGIETAAHYLQNDPTKNVKRVLLLTDGEASVGEQTHDGLAALVEGFAKHEIGLTALGFGAGYDEDLLSKLARVGGGALHHVSDPGKLAAVYAGELGRMRSLAARWIRIDVAGREGTRVLGVRHDFPTTRKGDALSVACSDLRSGETKGALVDLLVPPRAAGTELPLAEVKVTWQTAEGSEESRVHDLEVRHADAETAAKAPTNGQVLVQIALLDAARAKERALEDADSSNFASGSVRLMNSVARLGTARAYGPETAHLERELAELERIAKELEQGKLDADRRKEIRVQIHARGTASFRQPIDTGDGPPI